MSHRTVLRPLAAMGAALALVLTGCSGPSEGTGSETSEPTDSLEIFSWWTASAEAAALSALTTEFENTYPGVEITNAAVAGGGGGNARAVLQTRLQGGDPPDSWMAGPGELARQYYDAGVIQPVTDVYDDELRAAIPSAVLDNMTIDGEIYSAAAGVGRGNVLFYNKELVESNGIELSANTGMDDLMGTVDRLKAAGVTPFCLGDATIFGDQVILDALLLASLGPDARNGLFDGSTEWTDPGVAEAVENYQTLLANANTDHSALTSSEAAGYLADGKCAYYIAGDWAYGYLKQAGAEDQVDFGYIPVPDTAGEYIAIIDTFVVAKDAANVVNAKRWLQSLSTVESQRAFSLEKGSIPVRTDVPMDGFPPYQVAAAKDFAQDTIVWGFSTGQIGTPSLLQSFGDAITAVNGGGGVDAFQAAMASAS